MFQEEKPVGWCTPWLKLGTILQILLSHGREKHASVFLTWYSPLVFMVWLPFWFCFHELPLSQCFSLTFLSPGSFSHVYWVSEILNGGGGKAVPIVISLIGEMSCTFPICCPPKYIENLSITFPFIARICYRSLLAWATKSVWYCLSVYHYSGREVLTDKGKL